MNILCWLGFHSREVRHTWHPSYDAITVTALETEIMCSRCYKTVAHEIIEVPKLEDN